MSMDENSDQLYSCSFSMLIFVGLMIIEITNQYSLGYRFHHSEQSWFKKKTYQDFSGQITVGSKERVALQRSRRLMIIKYSAISSKVETSSAPVTPVVVNNASPFKPSLVLRRCDREVLRKLARTHSLSSMSRRWWCFSFF